MNKPIYKGTTMLEAVSVLGTGENNSTSGADHIFGQKWELADGSAIHITFIDPNYKDFMEKLSNREFILSDEPAEYTPAGTRIATPNEIKVFQEWYLNLPVQGAYIITNDVKKTLF